ncbi:MAG: von Willebrand factor type A domain-containing protein [Opitutaceae bacterium]|jgi:secreted protein with Ig-like and vWFA domain
MNNHDDNLKKTSDNPTPELEARVVAWVLGEASPFEVAELNRLCAEQPELAVFRRRIEAVHGLMGEAAKPLKTPLLLSPERRAKVLAVIGGAATVETVVAAPVKARKKARSWRSWALPMAACFTMMAILAAVMIPTVGSVKYSSRKAKEMSDQRMAQQQAYMDAQIRSNEAVDTSVRYSNATVERKAEAVGNRELNTDIPVSASGSLRAPQGVDGFSTYTGTTTVSSGTLGLDVSPAPASAPVGGTGGSVAGSHSGSFGFQQNGSDLMAATASSGSGQAKAARKGNTVTVMSGEPAELESRDNRESLRQLRDQGQALAFDADLAGAKRGELAFGNQSNARLESVPAEVRRRREIRNDLAADPFAASAATTSTATPVYFDAEAAKGLKQNDEVAFLEKAQSRLKAGDTAGARQALELYNEASNKAAADTVNSDVVSEEKDATKLVAKGRSEYLAGDLAAAQETFRALESVAPENADANSFLSRIEKEKSAVAELNRVKTRSQMVEEVTNAWQRPRVYQDKAEASAWKPEILGSKRERDDDSGITITAGTPLKMTVLELTDADKKEIERRVSKIKRERSVLGVAAKVDEESAKTAALAGFDLDQISAQNEVIAEIRAAEKQAAASDLAARKADLKPNELLLESFRSEIPTATEAVSTFSLHVSDASFRLAKAALERGQAPDPSTIRPEEFYNAFDYGDPSPAAGEPVSCRIEQAAHPFLQQRNLVRIAMRVPATGRGAGQPLRLTVLLDTSGSMEREDRTATVRAALTALTSLLGPDDRVTLVGFAHTPRLLAESVPGDQAGKLMELAASTPAEGGTNMEEALALAGDLAMRQKLDTAQNRIVLLTDGAANLGDADPEALAKRVEGFRQNGIAFDACGVVADGLDDSVLEALTRKGDGRYAVINSPEDADANFARQLAGAFRPAAKDVKVQVHFNPARVARYRLIGFEKHRLKTEDFRNDAVDAAELAAEEAAVAVYQVEVLPEGEGELGEVAVRFLDTRSNERVERTWTLGYVAQPAAFDRATPSLQLAGVSAFLAEKLRGGALTGQVRLDEFAPVVEGLSAAYPNAPRVQEFIQMFRQTRRLTGE